MSEKNVTSADPKATPVAAPGGQPAPVAAKDPNPAKDVAPTPVVVVETRTQPVDRTGDAPAPQVASSGQGQEINPDGDPDEIHPKYREPKGTVHSDQYRTAFPSEKGRSLPK